MIWLRLYIIVHKQAQAYCRIEDRLLLVGQARVPEGNELPFADEIKKIPKTSGEIERGRINRGLSRGVIAKVAVEEDIYSGVAKHHSLLESKAVFGPWAIVMGMGLFDRSDRTEARFCGISPRANREPPWH